MACCRLDKTTLSKARDKGHPEKAIINQVPNMPVDKRENKEAVSPLGFVDKPCALRPQALPLLLPSIVSTKLYIQQRVFHFNFNLLLFCS